MARSKWKLNFISNFIFRKLIFFKKKLILKKKNPIFYNRSSTVPHSFKKIYFRIHKGNGFRRIRINIYNIGLKFGEFSFTRKPFHFPIKKTNKKKNIYFRV